MMLGMGVMVCLGGYREREMEMRVGRIIRVLDRLGPVMMMVMCRRLVGNG